MHTENKDRIQFGTKLIHAKTDIGSHYGAVNVPIYQVSTFHQDVEADNRYDYSRSGNPTREALEQTVAQLEGGSAGFAFASGMAAIASVLCLFKSGDEIIVSHDSYGGTYRVLTQLFSRFGIKTLFVDTTDLTEIEKAVTPNTKGLYIESPSNPFLNVTDIKEASVIAKKHGLITIVDNTFMTPYLQQPLALGADIVIHSATKYIGGHSDVVAGVVVTASEELGKEVKFVQNAFGAVLGPQDSWLLLRGIKTLKVRLEQQQQTAGKMAQWLKDHPLVEKVYYPGLTDHPHHELSKRQASGFGAIISFTVKDEEAAHHFLKTVSLPSVGVSLGGVESILTHPATMSHASIPKETRDERGITGSLLRLSVGLEEAEDLQADFAHALESSLISNKA